MNDWNDVNIELPEESEEYLVAWTTGKLKRNFIGFCEYDAEKKEWYVQGMEQRKWYEGIEITYWMKAPEPPEKEEQNAGN